MSKLVSEASACYKELFVKSCLWGGVPLIAAGLAFEGISIFDEFAEVSTGDKVGFCFGALLTPVTAALALVFAALTAISAPFVFAVAAIMDCFDKEEDVVELEEHHIVAKC